MDHLPTLGAFLLLGLMLVLATMHLRQWLRLAPEQRRVDSPRWLLPLLVIISAALLALAYVTGDNVATLALVAAAVLLVQIRMMRHARGRG